MSQGSNWGGACGEWEREAQKEAEEMVRFEKEVAREHFRLAEAASPAVRPLLLFYGLFHLVKATYTSLTGRPFRERVHGLTCRLPQGEAPSSLSEVRVGLKAKGAFRVFERLYDPHPIPEGVSFPLSELLQGRGHASKIPPLSRHYLALFGLSHIARYEPELWRKALRGKEPTSEALLSYLERVGEECLKEVASVVEKRGQGT